MPLSLQRLVLALPCLFLSYALFSVWYDPMSWDQGRWVPYGVGIILVEFLVLHASVFVANFAATQELMKDKLKYFVGLAAVYLLTALGFALSTGSLSLVGVLAVIMASRFVAALQADAAAKKRQQARSAFAIVIYMLCVFSTLFTPIPELGITHSVLQEVYPQRGGGLWEREPQRAIAAGALYFAILGLAELFWPHRAKNVTAKEVP